MRPKYIGTFPLGNQNCDLYVDKDLAGGEFSTCPGEHDLPRITVGLSYDDWHDCLATLIHECFEAAMLIRQVRFCKSEKINGDMADYQFFFDHAEFGNICSMASTFLCDGLPMVAKEYRKQMGRS